MLSATLPPHYYGVSAILAISHVLQSSFSGFALQDHVLCIRLMLSNLNDGQTFMILLDTFWLRAIFKP